jgi:hypothetical protein
LCNPIARKRAGGWQAVGHLVEQQQTNMTSVRQELLRQFPTEDCVTEPDADVAAAVYAILWSTDDLVVDGWTLFRVVQESNDSLAAVGLMTLLPNGSIPISVTIRADEGELAWSAHTGLQDTGWLALSDSKRWNSVCLYATGVREEPEWTWDRRYQGRVHCADD